VAVAARHTPADLCGRTSLRDVIGVFERAAVAFGPDSGPMHVAAALGVPVVSLFGATSPARSGPYGFDHLVVEGDAACRPCYSRRCSIGRKCMEAITEDRVMAKLESALRERDATAGAGTAETPQ
jgi:ADP-heptose:LPS heptosyltransferase